ncbi:MAG: LysE family translocator [Massilia sp.]
MSGSSNLWLYFLVVFSVIALPGMDMAFVMGSSMVGGRRAGMAAVAGIVVGGVVHMAIGASGVFALLALVPAAFNAMLLVGAAYVAWIGWSLLRIDALAAPEISLRVRSRRATFAGAIATCLLNPKAYLFMLAIFPQFVHPAQGSIWLQALTLCLITAMTQVAVYGALAMLAARMKDGLVSRPRAGAWMARGAGVMLLLAAAFTLYAGLRAV